MYELPEVTNDVCQVKSGNLISVKLLAAAPLV